MVEAKSAESSHPHVLLLFFVSGLLGHLALSNLLQLMPPVQRLNKSARLPPARFDNHVQLEIHARSQQRLNLLARARSNLFKLRATLADKNRFLSIAFAIDRCGDARERQPRWRPTLLPRRRRGLCFFKLLTSRSNSAFRFCNCSTARSNFCSRSDSELLLEVWARSG